MKPIPGPLDALIGLAKSGKFPTSGLYTGTSGYAPYHDVASQVPANVDSEMQATLKGLTDGSIKTNVPPVKPAAPATPATGGGLSTTAIIIIVVIVLLVVAAIFYFRRKK
jgi:LPXTG-motif cell wall-anchored protein